MGLPSGTSEECSVERDRMGTGEDGSVRKSSCRRPDMESQNLCAGDPMPS